MELTAGCVSFVSFFLARRGFLRNVLGAGLFWKEWTARCFAERFVVRRHAVVSLASHGSQACGESSRVYENLCYFLVVEKYRNTLGF